jgi:hypothetical protein
VYRIILNDPLLSMVGAWHPGANWGCEPTLAYVKKRTREGKSKREIIRCLKRYIIREIFKHLCCPQVGKTAC